MATSSITKEFIVKDPEAFKKLQKELDASTAVREKVVDSSSLCKGKEKLATFVFR